MLTRYDNSTDIRTPEEIKQFHEEFNHWLQEFGIKLEESFKRVDELEGE